MTASSSFLPARTLIVYFSFTGNTETVARLLQKHTGATLMALERPADLCHLPAFFRPSFLDPPALSPGTPR